MSQETNCTCGCDCSPHQHKCVPMATTKAVQFRRGTAEENSVFVGLIAELSIDTTNWNIRLHDSVTPGGHIVAMESWVLMQIGDIWEKLNQFFINSGINPEDDDAWYKMYLHIRGMIDDLRDAFEEHTFETANQGTYEIKGHVRFATQAELDAGTPLVAIDAAAYKALKDWVIGQLDSLKSRVSALEGTSGAKIVATIRENTSGSEYSSFAPGRIVTGAYLNSIWAAGRFGIFGNSGGAASTLAQANIQISGLYIFTTENHTGGGGD